MTKRVCQIVTLIIGTVALIVAVGVFCGAYIPYRMFNDRVQEQVCDVFASVVPFTCTFGAITKTCYNVVRNTKPYGAKCWQAPTMATFESKAEADAYVAGWKGYSYRCLWDPRDPCEYYNEYADTVGMLVTTSIFGFFALGFFGMCIGVSCAKRCGYEMV